MKIRTPMNQADIELMTAKRNDLKTAATAYDAAYRALSCAIHDMNQAARGIDFFVEDPEITALIRNHPKTLKSFNSVANYAPSLKATRVVEIADEALAQAWN